MTSEELKDKKRRLEEEIAEKLQEFEKETKTEISDITYNRVRHQYSMGMFGISEVRVKIEVNI